MQLADFNLIPTTADAVKVGDLYGRLFVVLIGQVEGTYRYYAICQCVCGSKPVKRRFDLLTAHKSISCGCTSKPRRLFYTRWIHMMQRCFVSTNPAYPDYGGRGITVCKRWQTFENYVEDLPEGYFDGAHLDRINNDKGYEPGNLRWVSQKQNNDNKRTGVLITYDGRTQSITAWANEVGLPMHVIRSRIKEHNWPVEKALTTPVIEANERMAIARQVRWGNHVKKGPKTTRVHRTVEYQGRTWNMKQLSEHCGVPLKLLSKRLWERGWPIEKAVVSK